MTKHVINTNRMFSIDVTARESDEYSGKAFVKFERNYAPADGASQRCDEMFLSTEELRQLGYFLVEEAKYIEADQKARTLI